MRGTPTSRGQSFIARDHRYVYLGGSVIALVGLSLWYSAPSPYSFLPAGSVPGTALAAVCYFFLVVSTLALFVNPLKFGGGRARGAASAHQRGGDSAR